MCFNNGSNQGTYLASKMYLSKNDGKDQETIQSSTTPDPEYHMGKWQKYN